MSTQVKVVEEKEDVYVPENVISLKQFPPKVRKVAKYILEADQCPTWKHACSMTGVDYDTFRKLIWRARKKGHDFQKFIDEHSTSMLKMDRLAVHDALLRGAVSDSHADRKLYYQLIGDLKETTVNNQVTLNIGINAAPSIQVHGTEQKGVLDVDPMIPEDE